MKTSDLDYRLPPESIAQYPLEKRDESRLLVLHRDTGEIEHRIFKEIPEYLSAGDVLVVNNTKVLPARIYGKKKSGGKVEILLHRKRSGSTWEALVKPGKRFRVGDSIEIDPDLCTTVEECLEDGKRLLVFSTPIDEWLERNGTMPLPPYIRRAAEKSDRESYQTVYAKTTGAVAAPTAGLHFTEELLERVQSMGVGVCSVTLHVGLGTFRPVHAENVEEHRIDPEWARLEKSAAEQINAAIKRGKKIWAVGTTSVRVLESFSERNAVFPYEKEIDLCIFPPYKFKIVSGLITNFHLPRSSLLALVCALAGRDRTMETYGKAVQSGYRFYSYGDSMLIL